MWRSLESLEYVDPAQIVAYLRALGTTTTAPRVGWFLDSHREAFGEIRAELLTADPALQERIQPHPMLNWNALNVRKHRGL